MIKCPACGEENPPKFRLCGYCGAPLAGAAAVLPAHEVRKTVTLIFTDLKDSTALGERLDSEALHEVKERYFAAMAEEIKRHGGRIEKYIGDAIMAVFGLPRANEDDALRAVRAAVGMRDRLAEVNAALMQRFGVALAARTGVNTGEVVALDDPTADQKLATGDAVNVTARLEQAAPANEIYIGEVTYRLVRDAVVAEAVEPLTLKGKAQPVPAYKIISAPGLYGNERRTDTPVVGREAELAALLAAWQAACTTRRAQLVTVVGDAGVGKSRLVRELIDRVKGEARIVFGRCLSYGEGITFWPLREMVVAAAGIVRDDTPDEARAKILACVEDAEVADRLASAAGMGTRQFPLHEINWGARRFLQHLAKDGPVLAMIDDIHWAEPAFLDLMENLLDTVENAAVMMVATSRHELLESRADWSQRDGATRLVLSPLTDEAAAQVVANLLGAAGLPVELVRRIVAAAEGNPLYVEQMLSMLVDSGAVGPDGTARVDAALNIVVPPTIQALLEARLDKLERAERATAEPAAVVGMEFPRSALQSLAPVQIRDKLGDQLTALARKHFIRPAADDADPRFRFDHHLVRDTVYNGLLKRARATMHVEFVKWADQVNAESDRGQEFEAILGYHLEQAYKYLGELGPLDEAGAAIGRDGAKRLAAAGRRAFGRGDMHAAVGLLQRGANLLPQGDLTRAYLLPELAEGFMQLGQFDQAGVALEEARETAQKQGEERLKASASLIEMFVRLYGGEAGDWGSQALELAQSVVPVLEKAGADNELAVAWRLVGFVHGVAGQYGRADEANLKYLHHARSAGNDRLVARSARGVAIGALLGPTPVPEAIATCQQIVDAGNNDRQVQSVVLCVLAQLYAMQGDFVTARKLYQQGREILSELGASVSAAATSIDLARVELLAGDLEAAERALQVDFDFLTAMGENYLRSTLAAVFARVLRAAGRFDQSFEMTKVAEAAGADDDVETQTLWRSIRAVLLATRGETVEAMRLSQEALAYAAKTDGPLLRAEAMMDYAEVLDLSGADADARGAAGEALALYRAKGDVISARLALKKTGAA
jgi:class 3 adenylate cyclase/tetratricopeptide (TPR) repeat protein